MLFNPNKPVLQQGIDDYGGASGEPTRFSANNLREAPNAVAIYKNTQVAGYFMTGENSMVIFQQLGECQVDLPDIDDSITFKIPGFIIKCGNIRGKFAVISIEVLVHADNEPRYPTQLNVMEGSILARYLYAERIVPLV